MVALRILRTTVTASSFNPGNGQARYTNTLNPKIKQKQGGSPIFMGLSSSGQRFNSFQEKKTNEV